MLRKGALFASAAVRSSSENASLLPRFTQKVRVLQSSVTANSRLSVLPSHPTVKVLFSSQGFTTKTGVSPGRALLDRECKQMKRLLDEGKLSEFSQLVGNFSTLNIKPNNYWYSLMLQFYKFQPKSLGSGIAKILADMKERGLTPNYSLQTQLLKAALTQPSPLILSQVCEVVDTERLDNRALPYLAGRVFEAGCSSQGIKFLEEMITRKLRIFPNLTRKGIAACQARYDSGSLHRLATLALSEQIPNPDDEMQVTLLKAVRRTVDTDILKDLLDFCRKQETRISESDIIAILVSIAKQNHIICVDILLNWLNESGFKLSPAIYSMLLNIYTRSKMVRPFIRTVQEMIGEGITLSPQQVNEWCKSCVTATDELDIATETLERINETETLHTETVNVVLQACTQFGDMGRAYATIARMKSFGLTPTNQTLTLLLEGCAISGDYENAQKIVEKLKASEDLSQQAYEILVKAYCKVGKWSNALRTIRYMQHNGLVPSYETFKLVCLTCASNEKVSHAMDLIEDMKSVGYGIESSLAEQVLSYHQSSRGSPIPTSNFSSHTGNVARPMRKKPSFTASWP